MVELSLGERISRARKSKGISQAELARAIGIAQPSLSQIEAGKTAPRDITLRQIATELADDLHEPWLRQFLDEKNEPPARHIVEQVLSLIGANEFVLWGFVVRVADRLPAFERLIKPDELRTLRGKVADMEKMLDLFEKGDASWADYMDRIPGEVGPLEPATMILAPSLGVINVDEDDDEIPRQRTG